MEKTEEGLKDWKDKKRKKIWRTVKRPSILLIRVLKGQNTRKGGKRVSGEILADNFPKLVKDMNS